MKKFAFIVMVLVAGSLAWMGFVREPLPPIPTIVAEVSQEVPLDFSINAMDYTGVELSMNRKIEGKGMYVQFKMANAWKSGRAGLVLNGIKGNSGLRGMSPQNYLKDEKRKGNSGKDFSNFMADKRGKPVSSYSFRQTLVEDNSGKTFMRMSYNGPAMEMIQMLEIPRPVTIPAHVSKQFTSKGIIQFQPGTVAFDSKIKGFYIPVVIR
ncbi:hypothetical protein [Flavilitoribacter nigricans]|uniref:Uncharacterized protein n=1 Tax=Flavilitoribacter nigricans (strain ATCC 23147 / DSM 23189 / NBRC 102662 / NCIMB 1420 / SS-2) TaxID=1122177 RepID=A0A2D0NGY5_FLAN2|nr:hypothetical protein [Flavilitoribacter nigricans]PHN07751.1 hypothetical protein CRP01_04725 [Flavilitoribacter nigricans DSM 23189 = NBRC 102662]